MTGQFNVILYDQDTAFTRQEYVNNNWNLDDWTMQGDLSDALFLHTILKDPVIMEYYTSLAKEFVSQVYRPDQSGPLYQRMNVFADFVSRYNPARGDVTDKTSGFINWFITPLSQRLYEQLGLTTLPSVTLPQPACNSTVPI